MTKRKGNWYGWWRASRHPSVAVPVGGRSVGRAHGGPGWTHGNGTIHWFNFYWGEDGELGMLANGIETKVLGGHCLLHHSETRIEGYPSKVGGSYRWLTLDGPSAEAIINGFGFEFNTSIQCGPCPIGLFNQLEQAIQDVSAEAEYQAGCIAYEILAHAAQGRRGIQSGSRLTRHVQAAVNLIDSQLADPQLNVTFISEQLRTHRSQLSRDFRHELGLSPSEYIMKARLQRAMLLLRGPRQSVKEIARQCGFQDPAYFSRLLSKRMGVSPTKLRQTL